jgi:hypothetical protein
MNTVLRKVAKVLWKGLRSFLNGFLMVWLAAFYGVIGDIVGFEWWLETVMKGQYAEYHGGVTDGPTEA